MGASAVAPASTPAAPTNFRRVIGLPLSKVVLLPLVRRQNRIRGVERAPRNSRGARSTSGIRPARLLHADAPDLRSRPRAPDGGGRGPSVQLGLLRHVGIPSCRLSSPPRRAAPGPSAPFQLIWEHMDPGFLAAAPPVPPDPTWLGGYWDDDDFDNVVAFIASALAIVAPPIIDGGPLSVSAARVEPAQAVASSGSLQALACPRAPPVILSSDS